MIPRNIDFSYSGDSCVGRLTVLPGMLKSAGSSYDLTVEDKVSVGGLDMFGRSVCAKPTTAPEPGHNSARLSVGGTSFPALYFKITTPEAPSVALTAIEKPIAAARALEMPLSSHDVVFDYVLSSEDRSVDCEASNSALECSLVDLELSQGKTEPLVLERQFDGQTVDTVFEKQVEILPAVRVVKSSVKKDQTVFTKDKSFTFTVDKDLESASVKLISKKDDKATEHQLEVAVDKKDITVSASDDLPRSTDYKLTIQEVVAVDGSSLAGPHDIKFKLSGGPKVQSVSVPTTEIDPNAQITFKLDQDRKSSQKITDFVKIRGADAQISASDGSITVSLANAGRCNDITITIAKGLLSKYDVPTTEAWSWSGRTRCHTVETVGYSAEGRPINAYVFGNGNRTVMFTGAIHGSEKSGYDTTIAWVNDLEAQAKQIPSGVRVVVIPMVNPDGYYVYGRDNSRKVNLNRNFPTSNWASDIKVSGGQTDKGGGGKSAGSERETQVLMAATNRYNPSLTITYHSQGAIVNSNSAGSAATKGAQYARMVGYGFVPDEATESTFGFVMSGTYEDWLAETGRAGFLIELPSHYGNYLPSHRAAMWAMIGG